MKTFLRAYFKTFMRRLLAGQVPSALGTVLLLASVVPMQSEALSLFRQKSILPESSTEIMTLGATKGSTEPAGVCAKSIAQAACGAKAALIIDASSVFLK
ncbi:MAG: hypothetical protein ACK59X_35135 [Acidovorax sp.]